MAKEKQKIKIVCTECKGNGYVVVHQQPYHDNCPKCDQQGEIFIDEAQLKTIYAGANVIGH